MLGLSTTQALKFLRCEIEKILFEYEHKYLQESYYRKFAHAFVKRYDSPLGFVSIATSLTTTLALFIAECYLPGICLAAILSLDLLIVVRENNLRRTEIFRKIRYVLSELSLAEQELCHEWKAENYAHLFLPISPCVSLQWTYRDGCIVNLPFSLLVKGDYIVLRPGHIAPGPCQEVAGRKTFEANELYGVSQVPCDPPPIKPAARTPLPDLVCSLQTTPYLENLRLILENATKRPPTIYNQQRFLLVTKYIQQWGFIATLCITLLTGIVHMNSGSSSFHHSWKDLLIETPAAAVIPLLPLIFPLMWISMNLWGVARLQCFLKTPQMVINKEADKSFEEDLTPSYDYEKIEVMRGHVFRNWLELWKGNSELLPRSANVVQVLGSITALCCVDKKGILSWPNPTAEKVFFLHDADESHVDERSNSRATSLNSDSDEPNEADNDGKRGILAEVLDLTHDQHCPFRLEFDDHEWKSHIKSLKPLGLAILLNTCSPLTNEHYGQFCNHVTAVALLDKDLVPVTNRRCLCELAKQIGFTNHATDRFALEGQLATYRHLQPEVVRRDIRFARQLQLSSKVKVPFPHSLSVVMRENPGGYLSLFTQGTADIILDCCDDFWDGKDLRPLSAQDRKRALEFYQRSALTSYCTAFAYRPLRHTIHGALSGAGQPIAYLELPPESKIRMQHVTHCDFENQCHVSHSISTDSLLFSESKDEDIKDEEGCFEMQLHQVFIGMVTMQYQAQMDIVQLVEHLDRACIRFVHFSKENELRSRVFSEKMGLESGWNCHISLLSEAEAEKTTNKTATSQSPKSMGKNAHCSNTSAKINICINPSIAHQNTSINQSNMPLNSSHAVETTCTQNASKETHHSNITGEEKGAFLMPTNLESTKNLSSSAPGAISNHMVSIESDEERSRKQKQLDDESHKEDSASNASFACSQDSLNQPLDKHNHHRQSKDSALDENCRSMSIVTESTEQSAPVHFDMSNRAKLPRGIENIRPHLEKVDNVPLQVSLFTDCSAEATSEMLNIMQSYGEIVVCLGSSASNSNTDIFLQADCSIAVEPLYPQVCQDIPAYTEANLVNNKLRLSKKTKAEESFEPLSAVHEHLESALSSARPMQPNNNTISPIYLSRLLNSLPCSISVCRDDPLSLVAIIELSRRFSSGLWNCIQFWACCAGTLSIINILSACLSLPPLLTPLMVIYLMCIPVPLISLALAHIDVDTKTLMNRATGKKQTEYDTRVFGFVLWCYGCKFVTPILFLILSYCVFMAHPIEIIDVEEEYEKNLSNARNFAFLGILMHFVFISACFVHRDHSIWQKNPFRNRIWALSCFCIFLIHGFICFIQVLMNKVISENIGDTWPAILFLYLGSFVSLLVTEIAKWQEIKINTRYQRRARLDFGTKLGMNSPF